MNKRLIAIVDDNSDIRYMVTEICKAVNIDVIPCEDYKDAKKVLDGAGVDLFLVDFHLPMRDGADVVRMIRNQNKIVPIIMLTVENSSEVLERAKNAGANDYALKPIRAIDLISRIEAHLQYQEQAQYYSDYNRGISRPTLERICDTMRGYGQYVEVETIAEDSGVGVKSVYRYLKYMVQKNIVDVKYNYIDKQGRPRATYMLKAELSN